MRKETISSKTAKHVIFRQKRFLSRRLDSSPTTSHVANHEILTDSDRLDLLLTLRALQIPWFEILTSRAVWVYSIARLLSSVTFYMFLTEMPTFVDKVFGVPLTGNGLLNGVFHMIYATSTIGSGALSDYMIHKNVWSRTTIRKAFQCTSFIVAGAMLIIVTLVGYDYRWHVQSSESDNLNERTAGDFLRFSLLSSTYGIFPLPIFSCNYHAVTVLLCVASGAVALSGGGESSMALDIAPDYAGSVVGVGNTIGNVAAIIATNLVLFTHNPTVNTKHPLARDFLSMTR